MKYLLIIPFIFFGWVYLCSIMELYNKLFKKDTVLYALGCIFIEILSLIPLFYLLRLIYN